MTEFKRVYFGTVLGYVWSLMRPLMLFGVLLFVFTKVFKVGGDEVEHYPVLLLLGIVLFTFFQEASTNAVTSVVTQEGVVRKTQFPRLVIPLSTVLTGAFNLCLNLVVVFVFILAFGVDPTWTWLLFPFAVAALFVLTAAMSMALSVLYVRFRDVAIIWVVFAQVLFYATPILYPIDRLRKRDQVEHLLMINPLAVIFEQVRVWVLAEPGRPDRRPGRRRRRCDLLPAAAIFVGDLRLRRLDLQPRRAAHRRGPLARGARLAADADRLRGFDVQVPRPRRARRGGSAARSPSRPGRLRWGPGIRRRRSGAGRTTPAGRARLRSGRAGDERYLAAGARCPPGRRRSSCRRRRRRRRRAGSRSRAAAPGRGRCRPVGGRLGGRGQFGRRVGGEPYRRRARYRRR